jgi:hypothetical protein
MVTEAQFGSSVKAILNMDTPKKPRQKGRSCGSAIEVLLLDTTYAKGRVITFCMYRTSYMMNTKYTEFLSLGDFTRDVLLLKVIKM